MQKEKKTGRAERKMGHWQAGQRERERAAQLTNEQSRWGEESVAKCGQREGTERDMQNKAKAKHFKRKFRQKSAPINDIPRPRHRSLARPLADTKGQDTSSSACLPGEGRLGRGKG